MEDIMDSERLRERKVVGNRQDLLQHPVGAQALVFKFLGRSGGLDVGRREPYLVPYRILRGSVAGFPIGYTCGLQGCRNLVTY